MRAPIFQTPPSRSWTQLQGERRGQLRGERRGQLRGERRGQLPIALSIASPIALPIALAAALIVALGAACGASDNPGNRDGGSPPDAPAVTECADGAQRCNGTALEVCADDEFVPVQQCANQCNSVHGCVVCQPGTVTCDGDVSAQCRPDGSGFDEELCDPVQGMSCDADSGLCDGACAPRNLAQSYIGCEYYPTVTAQIVSNAFPFAVAVANTSSELATVTIDEGALSAPVAFTVEPGAVGVQTLPWVEPLKLCNGTGEFGCSASPTFETVVQPRGAYRLRSTRPVTVYQFSPLDYTDGAGTFTYTNDASLLLPATVLGSHYRVAAWQYWSDVDAPGLLAVTATRDRTLVTITPRAPSIGASGEPDFPADEPTSLYLDRGDVLQLVNVGGDLTGSEVVADNRVQVIGGHYCTNVPLEISACDHLEESMFPVETLGTEYVVTAPALPLFPNGKEQVIRIIAVEPDTELSYEPELPTAPNRILSAGDFIEIPDHAGDVLIKATDKILIAHYMQGQNTGGGVGDPAMTLAVPVAQYRTDYLFHAPTNYDLSYVNITAPIDATVVLDGVSIANFARIGGSDYGVVRVPLGGGLTGDGNHSATSDQPFGITVYGYGQYTSYFYPGGLDLAEIPVE